MTQASASHETAVLEILGNPYAVLHATIGRIRLRIPRLSGDRPYAHSLESALRSVSTITTVRINPSAQSLIVTYDSSLVLDREILGTIFSILDRVDTLGHLPEYKEFIPEQETSWLELLGELIDFLRVTTKNLLKSLGTATMTIGIIGVIAPLIPGTPFLILSSLCFFLDSCIPA